MGLNIYTINIFDLYNRIQNVNKIEKAVSSRYLVVFLEATNCTKVNTTSTLNLRSHTHAHALAWSCDYCL